MFKKNNLLRILLLSVVTLSLFLLSGCQIFAKTMAYPNRQPVIKNPENYGMKYENITIESTEGINLKGWLIPGSKDSICIITHPMNFTKYGYSVKNQGQFKVSDIEVEFIKTAKILNDLGHNVLMFDFRNHGESDKSKDGITGVGLNEWPDIIAALDYINNNETLKMKKIFFLSFCMGANSTIIAYSKNKEKFENVKLLVLVQPISMNVFVDSYMNDQFPVLKGLIPDIQKKCIELGGYNFSDMSPANYVKDLKIPALFVQAKSDKWTNINDIKSFYDKANDPKELLILEGKMHRFDTYNYFADNPQKLIEFIDKYL